MYDKKIVEALGLKHTTGDFGIEIEMEVNRYLEQTVELSPWRFEADGSLKGHAHELVIKKPLCLKEVKPAIQNLKAQMKLQGVSIKPTIRAGVHIHVNMQQHKVSDVFRFLGCYYPMETVLTNYCGSGRQGNLFCLRSRDAEYGLHLLSKAVQKGDLLNFKTDALRYSALNLQSLFNYGTLEFRAFATQKDLSSIVEWCEIIHKLKDYSLKNPAINSLNEVSAMGPKEWIRSVFGQKLAEKLYYPKLESDIITDVRNCQHLLYLMEERGL